MKGGIRRGNGSCIFRIFNIGKVSIGVTSFCYREWDKRFSCICWGWELYFLSLSLVYGIGIFYVIVVEIIS